ncbi:MULTISPECIES: STAS domain-containing protein [Nonomuraea]|uniref:Anti-sigma factor antagonist n=1 Tax=Nonomuraea mangrovi TaxID=2316207 RepID=A0ABW4T5U2_9ACTN
MDALTLRLVHHPPVSDLILTGDLDVISSPRLPSAVEAALLSGCRLLIVDTAELAFCDASGLRALLQAQRRVVDAGGSMRLAHVHGVLRRILEITDLAVVFPTTLPHEAGPRIEA